MFVDGYDLQVVAFASPELVKLWHLGRGALTPVFTATAIGVFIGAPLLGYLGDRHGRRLAIITSCVICGFGTLAITTAQNIDQLSLLRFVSGIGIGGLMPNIIALNTELSPHRLRATLTVLMFTGVTFGGFAPVLVATWLQPH